MQAVSEAILREKRKDPSLSTWIFVERVMGIEPTQAAWKAAILPLNYTRTSSNVLEYDTKTERLCQ